MTKLNKLIGLIQDNSHNGETQLFPSALSEIGLDAMETDKLIGKLSKSKAVLNWRIAFAPNKIQSTYPKQASFSSVQNDTYSVPVFLLRTDGKLLDQILNENLKSTFDDKKAVVRIGKEVVKLPQYKNEHYFCRVAFKYPPDEAVDWSEIYEGMAGVDVLDDKAAGEGKWRVVYDTVDAINNRIQEQTGMKLFRWNEKTVRRLH